MKNLFLVFIGGGLGSMLRYTVYRWMQSADLSSTLATFTVNITGSLLLGFVMGFVLKESQMANNLLLFLATGFCGGFTTFSTFAFENQAYLRTGDYVSFALYVVGSLVVGILAVITGIFFSKFI